MHGENYLEKILVGFDGSENSKKALKEAIEIAKRFSAEITAVNVYNVPAGQDLSQRILKKAEIMLEDGEVRFKIVSVLGSDTPKVITDMARREKFDLIVVGHRGMSAVKSYLMGSVSKRICSDSPVTILIVK